MMSSMRKQLLRITGLISLGLGIIGVFVPLMPTTIFLIISAACFIRSSDKLYNWLINHKVLGTYLRNVQMGAKMPRRVKFYIFIIFLITLVFSIHLVSQN